MKTYIIIPVVNCLDLTKGAIASIKLQGQYGLILIDNGSTDGTQEWAKNREDSGYVFEKFIYLRNDPGKSVAASWNQGVKLAFEDPECQYVAVLNNDIVLHPKTLTHLKEFMDKTGYLMVTGDNVKDRMGVDNLLNLELPVPYTDFDTWKIEGWRAEGPDFSCFMINRETIRVIGWFDENFQGAYCEDWDYHKRIQVARQHVEQHNDQNIEAERIHAKRLSTAPYYHYASQTLAKNALIRHDRAKQHGANESYYIRKWGAIHDQAMDEAGFRTPFGDATKGWRDWS